MTESLTARRLWIYLPDNPVLRCHRGAAANGSSARSPTEQGIQLPPTATVWTGAPSVRADAEKPAEAASKREADKGRELWLVLGDATAMETHRRRGKVTGVCAENMKFVARTVTGSL